MLIIGGLSALILTSAGWPNVRESFFDWGDFQDVFPEVLRGFWLDIKIFMVVEVVVLILGLVVALVRTAKAPALFPLRILAVVYTDVFRGVPTILLVYLIGFGVPALALDGLPTDPVILGGAALALSYGAYVAEVYRAGLRSVHRGQHDAALAIGLNERQTLRHVIVPQAVRNVGPPLLNDFIALQKDVALVAILGPQTAFRIAQIEASSDFIYTPLLAAAMLYLLITVPMARLLDRWGLGGIPALMASTPVLHIKGVTKSFGEREVLRGIDLEIAEHEAVALIGASGSGKSTLLRCIDLLEEIDDGDIYLDGEVITDPSVDAVAIRRRLGLVFQAYNLFPHLSVIDNVTLGRVHAEGLGQTEAVDEARALLVRFGLEGREDDRPERLSGGQQQRVALARAFAARPRAMLLDEVTSALDPELVGEVLEAVRDLKAQGVTMLLATHEMGFAREVADRVGFLHEGRLIEVGPPEQVLSEPREAETKRFLRRLLSAGRA